DPELQDGVQDQKQHREDDGELDHRLALLSIVRSSGHSQWDPWGAGGGKPCGGPHALGQRGPAAMKQTNYSLAITEFSMPEIAVLSRPSVTTTAMVMTPRTTAYSAIVWPVSSLKSA